MLPIEKLNVLRRAGGAVRTRGLDEATVLRFAANSPDLVSAIDEAHTRYLDLQSEMPELLGLDEVEQMRRVQADYVNFYGSDAKMGLHQDRDEEDFEAPVVSISLGDTALFRLGGTARGGKTQSLKLASGDVLILEGPSRLAFHGIDRVIGGSSTLLKDGGRINLTLRRVTKP